MVELNAIEARILTVLLKRKTYATTAQIARRARVSWNTAEEYLHLFYGRGWLSKRTVGRRIYWKAV
jgi:Mn-dependent DtxR family transcriptional regulator